MCKSTSLLGAIAIVSLLASGCAGPEKKFGRGMNNIFEAVRMGEMRRSMEQTALFDSPGEGSTTGFIRGLNRSLARTGIGIYEVVTFPIPTYDPIATNYLSPVPAYPDNYKPGLKSDSLYATDTSIGFSGGEVAPLLPGNRFKIFDN